MGRTANGKLDRKKCTSNIRQPHWFSTGIVYSGSQLTWSRPLGKAWLQDSWTQELLCSIQPHLTQANMLPWASSNAPCDGESLWDYKPAHSTKLSDPQLWRKSLKSILFNPDMDQPTAHNKSTLYTGINSPNIKILAFDLAESLYFYFLLSTKPLQATTSCLWAGSNQI